MRVWPAVAGGRPARGGGQRAARGAPGARGGRQGGHRPLQVVAPVVDVDLGQHVTWYWVGPDVMHSVTGISANDAGEDSDPGNPQPDHKLGSTFRLTFDQPGVYQFRCKLHPMRARRGGRVRHRGQPAATTPIRSRSSTSCSSTPTSPRCSWRAARFPRGGTTLNLALDDPSVIDAEIWHVAHGHRSTYAGWRQVARTHRLQLPVLRRPRAPLPARARPVCRLPAGAPTCSTT